MPEKIHLCAQITTSAVHWPNIYSTVNQCGTVVFLTFAGYTGEHCNHNVVNIVFWLASVMIVSNKPTKLLAMACKMQTVTGFNLAISTTALLFVLCCQSSSALVNAGQTFKQFAH